MSIEEKADSAITSYRDLLIKKDIRVTEVIRKDYNFEFMAERQKEKVKVQVYFGKKGVKTIFQGDEKSEFFKSIGNLILDEPSLELKDQTIGEPEEYIGSDECGKGDFFGPLVVAAVYLNKETKKILAESGVRDSKDLSDYQIKILAHKIKDAVGDNFQIVRINPVKYNELYEKFSNLNKILSWAHSKAIGNLLDNIDCRTVITDKFSKKDLDIVSHSKHSSVEFIQETKAEKYTAVAAASILARDSFIRWFEEGERKNLNLPKGSSLETEKFAKVLLKKIGEEKLSEIAKIHFKTFKKISS